MFTMTNPINPTRRAASLLLWLLLSPFKVSYMVLIGVLSIVRLLLETAVYVLMTPYRVISKLLSPKKTFTLPETPVRPNVPSRPLYILAQANKAGAGTPTSKLKTEPSQERDIDLNKEADVKKPISTKRVEFSESELPSAVDRQSVKPATRPSSKKIPRSGRKKSSVKPFTRYTLLYMLQNMLNIYVSDISNHTANPGKITLHAGTHDSRVASVDIIVEYDSNREITSQRIEPHNQSSESDMQLRDVLVAVCVVSIIDGIDKSLHIAEGKEGKDFTGNKHLRFLLSDRWLRGAKHNDGTPHRTQNDAIKGLLTDLSNRLRNMRPGTDFTDIDSPVQRSVIVGLLGLEGEQGINGDSPLCDFLSRALVSLPDFSMKKLGDIGLLGGVSPSPLSTDTRPTISGDELHTLFAVNIRSPLSEFIYNLSTKSAQINLNPTPPFSGNVDQERINLNRMWAALSRNEHKKQPLDTVYEGHNENSSVSSTPSTPMRNDPNQLLKTESDTASNKSDHSSVDSESSHESGNPNAFEWLSTNFNSLLGRGDSQITSNKL